MRNGRTALCLLGSLLFSVSMAGALIEYEPPPLDPGSMIGVPSPNGPAGAPSASPEYIPVAEPVEIIPVAEPVTPDPAPVRRAPRMAVTTLAEKDLLPVAQNQTQVAILGYHDFSYVNPPTDMRINTDTFREQMEYIKNSKIPVISMKDFSEWKQGQKTLPPYCILITIDDGWKSVYTDAYPILKEMGFPFTLFLYTNFVTGRGASLSIAQVKEMIQNGATIGSHSTSHLYPATWKKNQRKGPEHYRAAIEKEIRDSRIWLQSNLHSPVEAYCYPGGYHTPEMIQALPEFGYSFAMTVIPRKVLHDTSNWEIPRYMVLGKAPQTFKNAVTFPRSPKSPTSSAATAGALDNPTLPPPAEKVEPPANSTVKNELPNISIDLANPADILADSLEMRITGLGKVPAKIVPGTSILLWQPNRPFRTDTVRVRVSWKSASTNAQEYAEWEFGVTPELTSILPANLVQ